ncbi:MAG: argininosuccinate lyase [Thermoplasmata archaeon]
MSESSSTGTPVLAPSYLSPDAGRYLASLDVDRALAPYDLAGSLAHVAMLAEAGLVRAEEAARIRGGLRTIRREIEGGTFPWREELEDVHTNIEVRLTELIGPDARRLHTARSRNDQVALDERLWLKDAVRALLADVDALERALLARARPERGTLLPGYTHLQRAQPVSLAHHLLAHLWRLERDFGRLADLAQRADVSPLGAGALAGSTLPIDPASVARRLGFAGTFENSLDAVSDRDPLAELLFALALLSVHLSAIGEEWVLWTTAEFGFARAGPRLGSGSSLMPQKRNADVAELARGKAGRTIGELTALLVTLKGLPLAYDRDLQEDKGPVASAVARTRETLAALTRALDDLAFDRERMRAAALDPAARATDLAEALVRRGVPFREAHERVAALARGPAAALDPASVARALPEIAEDLPAIFDPSRLLDRRGSPGGPSPAAVDRQIARAEAALAGHAAVLSSLGRQAERIEELWKEERE